MVARITSKKLAQLEERIGHSFKTHDRLILALTHASITKKSGGISHYGRLEFLGDRVLGLCVAQILFETFPKATEGELSVRLNTLVSGNTCAEVADQIGLHDFIFAGADVKQIAGKRMRNVRADVVESLIAAIYLDAGLEAVSAFVKRYWGERFHVAGAGDKESKTALQEWAHANRFATPVYRINEQIGPDHDPVFVVEVIIVGTKGGVGNGHSKRTAEQDAAQLVLLREKAWIKKPDGTIVERNKQ